MKSAGNSRVELASAARRLSGAAVGLVDGHVVGGAQVDGETERLAGQTALVQAERQRDAERQLASANRRVAEIGVTLGGSRARRQFVDENEREYARVARVLHGVRDELERQQAVHGAARPAARVNRDADAVDGHVEADERQVFAAFQTPQVVDERVDRLARVLYAPQTSTRLAADVLGDELLR